ncbi:response regulator [Dokdonella sp. MW10]|uniref:response regulator n=1 Tax=Dokdonella sp. MW10 TaxID=2992926 RepID=UPI003F7E96FE
MTHVDTPRSVMVADDQPDILLAVSSILRREGHVVSCALDGAEALQMALEDPPDVAILDIDMPLKSGIELARVLRADPRTAHARLVAMTGSAAPGLHARCVAAGFDVVCWKPFSASTLLQALYAEPPDAEPPAGW